MNDPGYEERRNIVEEWMEKNGTIRLERDGRLPPERKKRLSAEERAAQADAADDPDLNKGEGEEE
mgnify:CR=1 FL=1|jgi:hypothetical protein